MQRCSLWTRSAAEGSHVAVARVTEASLLRARMPARALVPPVRPWDATTTQSASSGWRCASA